MNFLGSEGEDLAEAFLKKKGFRILARNYRTVIGEIDIIAQDGETVVFVEVKTRKNDTFGHPFESVNSRKRQKLKNLALLYLKKRGEEFPVRFDVLSIVCLENGKRTIHHIRDAFEV